MTLEREYLPCSFSFRNMACEEMNCATPVQCSFIIFVIMYLVMNSPCTALLHTETRKSVTIVVAEGFASKLRE